MSKIAKTRFEKVKEIFLEWSNRTDMNCYTKIFIYRHNPLVSFVWILILLVSSVITFWLIAKSVLDYFNYSVVSQIGTGYESKSLFPTVTICDYNPFTTLQAQEMFENVAQQNGIRPNDTNIWKYAKLFSQNPLHDKEKKKSFGLNLSQFECKFADNPCDMKTDFEWLWMYNYGNCWQFNSGLGKLTSNLKQTYNGLDLGLDLKVSLHQLENKYISQDGFLQGLIVFVHNNSFSPNGMEKSQRFVKPGEKTFIAVKRTFTHKKPSPYSQCIDLSGFSSDLYDLITSNRTYRQLDCFKLCRQKLYIQKCGCNIFNDYLNVDSNVKYCSNLSELACTDNLYFIHDREECEKVSCPLECNSVDYDLSVSSLVYSNSLNEKNSDFSSTVHLIIYYSTLEYTFINESPQTTELGLFASIGGTLGIFISLSLFTVFEFVEILILVIHALLF